MTKKEQKQNLIACAFVLALAAARDDSIGVDECRDTLSTIREMLRTEMNLDNLNPNMLILNTAGMSLETVSKLVADEMKEVQ